MKPVRSPIIAALATTANAVHGEKNSSEAIAPAITAIISPGKIKPRPADDSSATTRKITTSDQGPD